MAPHYELIVSAQGKWLLCRTMDGSPVVAEFADKQDAQRALFLFEKSERQTKSLVDFERARREFDQVLANAKSQGGLVSGYDHQLD